jgi:hypothetical protein
LILISFRKLNKRDIKIMAYKYDEENIFAKILRGEIPNETIL